MEKLSVEIKATGTGVKKVRVRHPGGQAAVMKVLQDILPAVEQLDRTIRSEPTPATAASGRGIGNLNR